MVHPSGTAATLNTAARRKTERQSKALASAPAATGARNDPRPQPAMARPTVRPLSSADELRTKCVMPAVNIKAMETPITAVPSTKIGNVGAAAAASDPTTMSIPPRLTSARGG